MTARRPYLRFLPALTRVLGIVFIGATIAPIADRRCPLAIRSSNGTKLPRIRW